MNTGPEVSRPPTAHVAGCIAVATARQAPTWPLDEFIAVNPYWGWIDRPIGDAAAMLGVLAGTRLTMPREWYREQWTAGTFQLGHLEAAASEAVGDTNAPDDAGTRRKSLVAELLDALGGRSTPPSRLPLVTDLVACARPGSSWSDVVTHQVSQHCAAFFDRHQASWSMDTAEGLYGTWRTQLAADRGLPWRLTRARMRARIEALPATPQALVDAALAAMAMPQAGREHYLTAVLMAIGGWAAWCSYRRWQAQLRNDDDDTIVQLLAIRVAWEWLLLEDALPGSVPASWTSRWERAEAAIDALRTAQRIDFLLQRATEIAYQHTLVSGLSRPPQDLASGSVAVQAVFCIDVRSEVFRRALESQSPAVHTRGFAGFFGLPISYSPLGTALERPQLPGLLAPAYRASEQPDDARLGDRLAARRRNALQWRRRWEEFRGAPASGFSFVETMGLAYGAGLVKSALPSSAAAVRWEDAGLPRPLAGKLRPTLNHVATDPDAAAAIARGILTAMGLVSGFAPLVLLAGHGSHTTNNPHAAGLDCGACGGQTGEVNARVLAGILNTPTVRERLRSVGIDIPGRTHFLAALHNTTTDEVMLYDTDCVPSALQPEVTRLREWLDAAGRRARAERAESLGLGALATHDVALMRAVRERANDWSQVRPEWGLANNAALIVAPRARSRHLDLAGRCFLHDYDCRTDPDLAVLTLIMTAPMVVANWINLQYLASTVDNRRYGSGNKLLHNVVGGNLGVFEGNGGDLRIGLPIQSLHDGRRLRHAPLRLSVFIEAPKLAIDAVIARHATVRHLVENQWLHLFRIDPDTGIVDQRGTGAWRPADGRVRRN